MQISILSVFLMILWTWNFVTCKNSGILLLMEKILHQFIQWFTWFTRFYTSQLLRSLSNDLHDLQGVYTSQVVLGFLPSTVPNPSPKIFLRPHIQQSSWSAVTWTYEFVGILRLKSWWPKMTPGVNRRNKKEFNFRPQHIVCEGHQTSVWAFSHSTRFSKMKTAELCLWTSAFALQNAGVF